MKLIRFGEKNKEKPGIQLDDDRRIDVSSFIDDYDENFFYKIGIKKLRSWLNKNKEKCPIIDNNIRIGPPISRPSKIVCVGLNYAKHAAESGMKIPDEPVLFFKSSSAITGPYDPIIIPKNSSKTDWEVELAIVMGKRASYVSKEDALNYIAGYVLHNDVSEREFQIERSGQWVKGKSCDSFAPIGPFIATADEIENAVNEFTRYKDCKDSRKIDDIIKNQKERFFIP